MDSISRKPGGVAEPTSATPVPDSGIYAYPPSQKRSRCRSYQSEHRDKEPRYFKHSKKELLLMEHVNNFKHHFEVVYGNKYLFLCPPNEFGLEKFLPTTVRPAYLPFREFYYYNTCAQMLADYMNYEPLNPPDTYPSVIPAPSSVLQWQIGDSFDFSIVLCSLLLGVGYDAYCVSGIAPKHVTDCDQASRQVKQRNKGGLASEKKPAALQREALVSRLSTLPHSDLRDMEAEGEAVWDVPTVGRVKSRGERAREGEGEAGGSNSPPPSAPSLGMTSSIPKGKHTDETYVINRKPALLSQYRKKKGEERIAKLREKRRLALLSDSDEGYPKDKDPLANKRVHCWVLIKAGKREVPEDLFLEPTTGAAYLLDEAPYKQIHFVWNNKNFWISMDSPGPVKGSGDASIPVSLDLFDSSKFEYVMPVHTQKKMEQTEEDAVEGDLPAEEEEAAVTEGDGLAGLFRSPLGVVHQLIDLPPPWPLPLEIPREKHRAKFYNGEKTVFYHKTKVQMFAPHSQVDGCIQRVTKFKDLKRLIPLEIRESFRPRRDLLRSRLRKPFEFLTKESFQEGREEALKESLVIGGRYRRLTFYPSRLEGLITHEEFLTHEDAEARKNGDGALVDKEVAEGEGSKGLYAKIVETFQGRDDRLVYSSITLQGDGNLPENKDADTLELDGQNYVIRKMSKKFLRNPAVPYEEDIMKIIFYLSESKIRIDFHPRENSIVTEQIMLQKLDAELHVQQDFNKFRKGPKRLDPPPHTLQKFLYLQRENIITWKNQSAQNAEQLYKLRSREERTIAQIRSLLAQHKAQKPGGAGQEDGAAGQEGGADQDPDAAAAETAAAAVDICGQGGVLVKDHFDVAREQASLDVLKAGEEEEKEEEGSQRNDILAPYLLTYGDKPLDAATAEFVAKQCKTEFRKRLLDRSAIIQKRLEMEHEELKKKRALLQRRNDSHEKDEKEFERFQTQATFRIQILEQRLARHEMQSIAKFAQLEKTLAEHPRLQAMWQRKN
uniref:Dynein regulatory complex subunit 7 n=1 Tax=Chromera velia CCMP2878 TaxID=1169474 RepID=A0A0G4H8L1_9ALVE|eukprot:Cvel_25142.t1-p1 / transcript=Cvel_25142.t1 / gene=Cvel_25142 / organism=Chromera_velia_CCMP2878 / gene_product=Coiled-coil domain-containing protein lobo homolog, putative / transcript_product=Coiled-coil domain-containing protein lobo homolog, putative / location=Cvel_scaffold2811:4956-14887(-) / protein_length=1002 / sequence_SO=supercontig / SO=protein_coding / is_pseudo=false